MSRIKEKFAELKSYNRKALITFLTAGDPDINTTKEIIIEMEKKGADLIEIGIPYSDPIAEGPVIQRANVRALSNNIKIADIMNEVYNLRTINNVKVPLVYLMYFNCIFKFGVEKFFYECKRVGIDGVIIPDIPFEEQDELRGIMDQFGIDLITLVAPTSKERIEKIAKNASGFLYCVTSLGVTGVRSNFETNFAEFFDYINKYTKIPKVLGFGISNEEHVRKLKGYCDGLIIGSAIVKIIEESVNENKIINVGAYVENMRKALDDNTQG